MGSMGPDHFYGKMMLGICGLEGRSIFILPSLPLATRVHPHPLSIIHFARPYIILPSLPFVVNIKSEYHTNP